MPKVWVKGFTKSNGTKVKGHYRNVEKPFSATITDPATGKKTRSVFRNMKALNKELDWMYNNRRKIAEYSIG